MKMTLREAADFVNRDKSTLFRAIKQGELAYTTNESNVIFVEKDDLDKLYPPITDDNQIEIKKRGRPAGKKTEASLFVQSSDNTAILRILDAHIHKIQIILDGVQHQDYQTQQKLHQLEDQITLVKQHFIQIEQKLDYIAQKNDKNHQEILEKIEKSFTPSAKTVKKWWHKWFL